MRFFLQKNELGVEYFQIYVSDQSSLLFKLPLTGSSDERGMCNCKAQKEPCLCRISSLLPRTYLWSLHLSLALIVCFAGAGRAQSPLDGFDPNANGEVSVTRIENAGFQVACLQKDVKLDEVVTAGPGGVKNVTVNDKLIALKAHCRRGMLVDRKGKRIYFYALKGCWGNPPAGYLTILERQNKEIAALKKRYTVVEMTCNSGGMPLQ